jgi:hypothetical protein
MMRLLLPRCCLRRVALHDTGVCVPTIQRWICARAPQKLPGRGRVKAASSPLLDPLHRGSGPRLADLPRSRELLPLESSGRLVTDSPIDKDAERVMTAYRNRAMTSQVGVPAMQRSRCFPSPRIPASVIGRLAASLFAAPVSPCPCQCSGVSISVVLSVCVRVPPR